MKKEEIIKILKVVTIWFLLPIIAWIIVELLQGNFIQLFSSRETYIGIFSYICVVLLIFLCFLPIIGLVWQLCKNIESSKKKILLSAFLIPFSNMIYYFLEIIITPNMDGGVSMILGWFSLILVIFITIMSIITPRKYLPYKKEISLTFSLMFVFALILIKLSLIFTDKIVETKGLVGVDAYKQTIEYIQNFYKENGKYPENIDNAIKPKRVIFSNYEYKTYDNKTGFVLRISGKSPDNYRYCSSEKYTGCKEDDGKSYGYKYTNVGGWIRESYVD